MFGQYFKHVLALTLLASLTYSLPQVKDAMAHAFYIGYVDSSAYAVAAVGDLAKVASGPVTVKEIRAKVVYESKYQESSIAITAKVQFTATDSDTYISNDSFYFILRNKNLNVETYANSSGVVSNLTKDANGNYLVKKGTTALFSITASVNPKSMIAGQYTASLTGVLTNSGKFAAPANNSNTIIVVGEASPYITVVGSGLYGTQDTLILNTVRLGRNPTISFQLNNQVCPVGQTCPVIQIKTYPLRGSQNSKQVKFSLAENTIAAGSYTIFVTNTELGSTAGKSNYQSIQVLDQSKILTAKVIPGKLALTYDANNQEASLSAQFEVTIKAGDEALSIDSNSFYVSGASNVVLKSVNGFINTIPTYTLPAGKEARFLIAASNNPKLMFAGQYSMSLIGVYPISASGNKVYVQVNKNETNVVTIIGEVSPYINSVNPNPAVVGQTFSVNGVRLNDSGMVGFGTVYIDGVAVSGVDGSKDGSVLFFKLPSIADGYHILYVKNVNGQSNTMWFESTGYVSPYSVTVLSPNGGENYNIGNTIPVTWTSNYDSTSVKVHLYSSTLGDVYTSGPLVSSGKGSTNNYYNIPVNAADMVGQYKVNVCDDNQSPVGLPGKSLCDLSDNYFTISTSTPVPSITALTPSSNVTWTLGQVYPITWTSSNPRPTDTVKVWLKNETGTYYNVISTTAPLPNTGSANITIPNDGTIPAGTYSIEYRFGPAIKSVASGMVTIVAPVPCVPTQGHICEI